MCKILIITNHSYMLYRFRKELIEQLAKEHEVVLCMPFVGHEADFQAMGLSCVHIPVDRRGVNPLHDLKLFFAYRRLLKRERPELVLTYSIKPNIYGGIAAALAGIPFCANVQGLGSAFQRPGLERLVTFLYRAALGQAKTVFFENAGDIQKFADRGIIPAEKAVLLKGSGVNLREYPLTEYPEDGPFRFLFLGRIMKEKGIDELFEAMGQLRRELGDAVALDLVGFFEDDCAYRLRDLTAEGTAVFHGFQTDPRPFYELAHCVVLPSHHEGMNNVLLEASAMGRPVITTDIFGCREAVDPERTGFLCRPRDPESLYTQMRRMAALPRKDREAMGRAARAKMEREFDRDAVVRQVLETLF